MNKWMTGLLLSLLVLPAYAQPGNPEKGKVIASSICYACHGLDGVSPIPTQPHLAAQIPDYVVKQLNDMKSVNGAPPARDNPIMAGIVSMLSAEDMRNVAAWYAIQPPHLTRANDPKLVSIGQKIWRGGDADRDVPACSSCHGPTGAGVPAPYPRLSGQYQEYTELQLQHFKEGTRSNDPAAVMRTIAHRLTNEEIKALSDYAAGVY
ncbi:c-type cytochrome [Ferrovum myxofaciens]|jgi:cytochrome c553|uniref:Cytochrome c4 n=2 Tax=root TaxID=1 RepID=A0A8F3IGF1_9PROT|nr:c-type cytochrome [Ferrovum myxofaciens]KXW58559.1 cytochrome c4 precursor [Ferrovum myxofaciens]MBU6994608.1 cytochrome c4 [Ferrovum myxofaciens]QKE39751.2 MAG: cytochrome c4 [Ferrovum myxofaciens]QWY73656.1 MAG: cytochrome c4 [Ferrovum myxofaciens]QWY76410.1 MAG: cytochrome c4 [Ferrovum myxofaciens]